jgi:hypothetical protein
MMGRRSRAAAAAVFAALVLGACGSPSAKYVKNSDLGVFLKVPDTWTVFEVQTNGPGLVNMGSQVAKLAWMVGFDGAAQPARAHLDEAVPAEPVGSLQILPAIGSSIEHSVSGLIKALSTGSDSAGQSVPFDVIESGELSFPSGHWGVRIIMKAEVGDGTTRQAERMALFDSSGSYLYVLEVACDPGCFDANRAAINDIFQSLTMMAIK